MVNRDHVESSSREEFPSGGNNASSMEVVEALASLQLPQMPCSNPDTATAALNALPKQQYSFTVLVCADIDLNSSSALSEYILHQRDKKQPCQGQTIDLVIAAGPCVRDEDVLPYCQGKQHAKVQDRKLRQTCNQRTYSTGPSFSDTNRNAMAPFFRSAEETAALEGLLTASLSQLESIVCRVLYCPGYSDPLPHAERPRRQTPNTRSIHQEWMPLVPGLGCTGLFYLDGTDKLLADYDQTYQRHENEGDDDSEASDEEEDSLANLSEQVRKMQQPAVHDGGYCSTLTKLLQLPPTPRHPSNLPFVGSNTNVQQSILVTHYLDCRLLLQHDDSIFCDDDGEPTFEDFYDENNNHKANSTRTSERSVKSESSTTPAATGGALPWPTMEHDAFMSNPVTQERLCLEIASGSAAYNKPAAWIPGRPKQSPEHDEQSTHARTKCTNGPVLLPGSLRERGEFSILRFELVENEAGMFSWRVQNVDFHHLDQR